jgi:HSP20 family protein
MTDAFDSFLDLRRRLYRTLDAGISETVQRGATFTPPLDIVSDPDGLTISVELPGMAREDVAIELQGNLLTISGCRVPASLRDASGAETRCHRRERPCGRFTRALALPTSNHEALSAALKDGVLTIKIARKGAEA